MKIYRVRYGTRAFSLFVTLLVGALIIVRGSLASPSFSQGVTLTVRVFSDSMGVGYPCQGCNGILDSGEVGLPPLPPIEIAVQDAGTGQEIARQWARHHSDKGASYASFPLPAGSDFLVEITDLPPEFQLCPNSRHVRRLAATDLVGGHAFISFSLWHGCPLMEGLPTLEATATPPATPTPDGSQPATSTPRPTRRPTRTPIPTGTPTATPAACPLDDVSGTYNVWIQNVRDDCGFGLASGQGTAEVFQDGTTLVINAEGFSTQGTIDPDSGRFRVRASLPSLGPCEHGCQAEVDGRFDLSENPLTFSGDGEITALDEGGGVACRTRFNMSGRRTSCSR